jgi:hypothetical protein
MSIFRGLRAAPELCALLAWPVVLWTLNPNILFPLLKGGIDTWVNTGAMLSLPSHFQEFGHTYYLSRLSWLLPAYVMHALLAPVPAHFVLHAGQYLLLLLATFEIVRMNGTPRGALWAAMLIACCPEILNAIGWDYVSGASLVYAMLCLLSLEKVIAGRKRLIWSFLGGVFYAGLANTNYFLLILGLIYSSHYLLRTHRTLMQMAKEFLPAICGAMLLTAGLAWTSQALGGPFLIFMPSLTVGQALTSRPNPWRLASYDLWRAAWWLVIPALAAIGALIKVIRERHDLRRRPISFATTIQIDLLLIVLLWCLLEWKPAAVLSVPFYSLQLVPWALLALFYQVFSRLHEPPGIWRFGSLGLPAVLLGWQCIVNPIRLWSYQSRDSLFQTLGRWLPPVAWFTNNIVVFALFLGMLVLVIVWMRDPRKISTLRQHVVLAIMGLLYANNTPLGLQEKTAVLFSGSITDSRAQYRIICSAHLYLQTQRAQKTFRFWYNGQHPLGADVLRGVASTYLWGYRLLNETYPVVTAKEAAILDRNTRLVVMRGPQDVFIRLEDVLVPFGWRPIPVATRTFSDQKVGFALDVFDLEKAPR